MTWWVRERDGSGRDTRPVKGVARGGMAHSRDHTHDGAETLEWGSGEVGHRETMLRHEQNTASMKKVGRSQVGLQGSKLSSRRKTERVMRITGIMEMRLERSIWRQGEKLNSFLRISIFLVIKERGEGSPFLMSEHLCSQVLKDSLFISDPVPEFLNGLRVTSLKGRVCRARSKCPRVSLSDRALVFPPMSCMSLG